MQEWGSAYTRDSLYASIYGKRPSSASLEVWSVGMTAQCGWWDACSTVGHDRHGLTTEPHLLLWLFSTFSNNNFIKWQAPMLCQKPMILQGDKINTQTCQLMHFPTQVPCLKRWQQPSENNYKVTSLVCIQQRSQAHATNTVLSTLFALQWCRTESDTRDWWNYIFEAHAWILLRNDETLTFNHFFQKISEGFLFKFHVAYN